MSKYKVTQPILYSFEPLEPSAPKKNDSYSASKVSSKDSLNFGEKNWRKPNEKDAKKQSANSKNEKPVAPPVPPKTKAANKLPIVSASLAKPEQTTKSYDSSVLSIPIVDGADQSLNERSSRSATDFSTKSSGKGKSSSRSRSRSRSKTREALKESMFLTKTDLDVVPIANWPETSFTPTVQNTQSKSLKESSQSQNGKANVMTVYERDKVSSQVSPAIPGLKEFTPTMRVTSQITNDSGRHYLPKSVKIGAQNLKESSFTQNGDFHDKGMKRSRSLPRFDSELQMKEQAEPIVLMADPIYQYECSAFNPHNHSARRPVTAQECRQESFLATTRVQCELQPAVSLSLSYCAVPPPEYLKVRAVKGKKYQNGSGSLKLIRRRKAAEAAVNTSVSLYDPSCSSLSAGKKPIGFGSPSNATLSMSRLPIYNRFRTDPQYDKLGTGTATWRPKLEEKRPTTFGMYEYAEIRL